MKNEKMDKMMRKARVNLKLAKLKAKDLAKAAGDKIEETGKKLDAAWNAANKAYHEYNEEQEKIEEKKCNCSCCHCHDKDGDEVQESVEPEFEVVMEPENEEQPKDEE